MEPTTDLLDLSGVSVEALERTLLENPAAEAARSELEERAHVDGEAGTDARAALTRLDEAARFVAAAMDSRDEGTGASMARQAAEAGPHPSMARYAAARAEAVEAEVLPATETPEAALRRIAGNATQAVKALGRYAARRHRLAAVEVRDTQAARTAKLELELEEALDALNDIADALGVGGILNTPQEA